MEILAVGTRVRIKDTLSKGLVGRASQMQKFTGQYVTICEVMPQKGGGCLYYIEEDYGDGPALQNGHWLWDGEWFDVVDEEPDIEPASSADLVKLLGALLE